MTGDIGREEQSGEYGERCGEERDEQKESRGVIEEERDGQREEGGGASEEKLKAQGIHCTADMAVLALAESALGGMFRPG